MEQPRIQIIDDEPFYLELLNDALSPYYRISLAKNGEQGLKRALGATRPDLILLDITMPGIDGYQTCEALKANPLTQDIPVIFLTAKQTPENEIRAFEVGALDYITKPISVPVLLTRVKAQISLATRRTALEQLVQERTEELERTKDAIVYVMGQMAESRDEETGNHLIRTREYVAHLAQEMAKFPAYTSTLNKRVIHNISRAAPLHDIGKIRIPDKILRKPERLTQEEIEIMRRHPEYGRMSIESAEKKIGSTLFIQVAKEVTYSHHEKWDGSGYPQGLHGEAIPLSARLMALADVYDALVSQRVYKTAYSHDDTVERILAKSGEHFDPDVVACFRNIHEQFREIAFTYQDDTPAPSDGLRSDL